MSYTRIPNFVVPGGNGSVPAGGNNGYVLSKASAADYDVHWGSTVKIASIQDGADVESIAVEDRFLRNATGQATVVWDYGQLLAGDGNLSVDWFNRYTRSSNDSLSVDFENRLLANSAEQTVLDWNQSRLYLTSGGISVNWQEKIGYDDNNDPSIDWRNRLLREDSDNAVSVDWQNRLLGDSNEATAMDWESRFAYNTLGDVTIDWSSSTLRRLSASEDNFTSVDWKNCRLEFDEAVYVSWNNGLGFYGKTPVAQPTSSGAATAGVLYTSTEQAMLQQAYNALRALGLMS